MIKFFFDLNFRILCFVFESFFQEDLGIFCVENFVIEVQGIQEIECYYFCLLLNIKDRKMVDKWKVDIMYSQIIDRQMIDEQLDN